MHENDKEDEEFYIFVHALAGQVTPDTIKLLGIVGKHKITVLIDTGSTHSFSDVCATKRLGCELEYANPLMVTIAYGTS